MPNMVTVPVGADGIVDIFAQRGGHVLVDLLGYPVTHTLMGLGAYPASDRKFLGMIPPGGTEEYIARRAEMLRELPPPGAYERCFRRPCSGGRGLRRDRRAYPASASQTACGAPPPGRREVFTAGLPQRRAGPERSAEAGRGSRSAEGAVKADEGEPASKTTHIACTSPPSSGRREVFMADLLEEHGPGREHKTP